MASIEKSIEVHVPVHTAYNQCTQFAEFPRFMEGVEDVRQIESRGIGMGSWRGQVQGGQSQGAFDPATASANRPADLPPEGVGDRIDYPAGDPADAPGPEGVGDRVDVGAAPGVAVPPEGTGDQL
jgi:hypothetical protein